ncbi:hypothetical protein NKG94_42375 [Micromonospora sp. M12]
MGNPVDSARTSRTRRSAAAAVGVTLVAALVTPTAAQGAPPSPPPPATPTSTGGTSRTPVTVTLITGDRVTVTPASPGRPSVDVERAPGGTGSVRISTEGTDTYVYPDEAMPYLATGRLDRQLFDVTQLIAQGYDDARASELP